MIAWIAIVIGMTVVFVVVVVVSFAWIEYREMPPERRKDWQ